MRRISKKILTATVFLSAIILFWQSEAMARSIEEVRDEQADIEYETFNVNLNLLRVSGLDAISGCRADLFNSAMGGLDALSHETNGIAESHRALQIAALQHLADILREMGSLVNDPDYSSVVGNATLGITTSIMGAMVPGVGDIATIIGATQSAATAANDLVNQAKTAGIRDEILNLATDQVGEIKKIVNDWQKWNDLYEKIEKTKAELRSRWESLCLDKGNVNLPPRETDLPAWQQVAKGGITDSATGKPLDGTVLVIPSGEDDVSKPGDDAPPLQPGDTIIVTAPCHEKRTFIVGLGGPPPGLALENKPLKFVVPCDNFFDILDGIEKGLAERGIVCESLRRKVGQWIVDGSLNNRKTDVEIKEIFKQGRTRFCELVLKKICQAQTEKCPDLTTASGGKIIGGIQPDLKPSPDKQPPGAGSDDWMDDWIFLPPVEDIFGEPDLERSGQEIAGFPNDPFYHSKGSWGQSYEDQWAFKRIGFTFEKGKPSLLPEKAHPVVVAVIDTGIDRHHPELLGAIWINKKEIPNNGKDDDGNGYIDDFYGWNFVDNNNNTLDNNGHGTFVAGIIAAMPDNSLGIAGVNPWARIMPVKATDFNNKGGSINLSKAIIYAVDNGARVINISIGGKRLSRLEQRAVNYANSKGVVVVVASGNEGVNTNDFSPAGLKGVITVASTDMNDNRVGFSNWGKEVDIAAPGVDVLSLRAKKTDLLILEKGAYKKGAAIVGKDKRYYRTTGSSFSAPFVSGVASLILSINPKLTGEQIKRMVPQSAKDIDVPGKDQYTGYGLLDAGAALSADPNFFLDVIIDSVKAVKKGNKVFVEVTGTVDSDSLKEVRIEIGKGENPDEWKTVVKGIASRIKSSSIGTIPAKELSGASQWIIRLVAEHKNGRQREARFVLKLK